MLIEVCIAILTYVASVAIYRLFLSPLARARIPGPWLPVLTGMYEMYFDLKLEGRFPWKLREWHQQYGPIVRIAPDQVHIHDPAYVMQFFTSQVLRERYPQHQKQLGVDLATIGTSESSVHRRRRAGLAPILSSKKVHGPVVSHLVRAKAELVDEHLARAQQTSSVVDMRTLFWALATDIVSDLTFHEGHGLLDDKELDPSVKAFQEEGQRMFHWFKWFPFLWKVLKSIPPARMVRMNPNMKRLIEWEERKKAQIRAAIRARDGGQSAAANNNNNFQGTPCVFEHLLASPALSDAEKRYERIWEESASLLGAGVATVTNVLCIVFFHLLNRPAKWQRLSDELHEAIPDASNIPPASDLLRLSYLNAVLYEGLRMAFGLTQRIARVAPHDAVVYGRYSIPAGTAIGMSSFLTHTDPRVFPEPDVFTPERWLPVMNDTETMRRNRELILTFGKGARQCLGIHLAHAEILCTLAMLVRRYKFELYETTRRDVDVVRDSLLPIHSQGSQGVRVKVLSTGAGVR